MSNKITITKISGLHSKFLVINPPLVVEYFHDDNDKNLIWIEYDFGMVDKFYIDEKRNCLINKHFGVTNKSSIKERVKVNIIYDLQHAFEHCDMDPNYEHRHWALKGNLYDRVKIIE